MKSVGLVLEGGGMRGAYTAGVLDAFLEHDLHFPYVVGSSAGACNGSSYVARQKGRNYKVIVDYGSHPEYISFKRWLTKRQLFGMDFIFDRLPNELVPFDYLTFEEQKTVFEVMTTCMRTGEPKTLREFRDRASLLKAVRASSSIPMLAPSVDYEGEQLMDGGIASPIPLQSSIDYGNEKHVVILTRNDGHIKKRMKASWYISNLYKQYPDFAQTIVRRHQIYNEQLTHIKQLEQSNRAFVFRPQIPIKVSRVERKREKLHALYIQGFTEADNQMAQLKKYLKR